MCEHKHLIFDHTVDYFITGNVESEAIFYCDECKQYIKETELDDERD